MIKWQDDKDVFGRMHVLTGDPLFKNLTNAVDHFDVDLTDAVSWGQLKSKRWLVDLLEESDGEIDLGTVFICGGWWATLAAMLFNSKLDIEKIRSFDIDETCAPIAEAINKEQVRDGWKFKASTLDIHDLQYKGFPYTTHRSDGSEVELVDTANTIINTSCEHIENFYSWYNVIPKGTLVILQSNNYEEILDHVNCSKTIEEFSITTPMTRVLYEGELYLPEYTRFMKIGIK